MATQVSKELRKIRIDQEINRKQMAKKIGLTERQLINIEAGKQVLNDDTINKIAEVFANTMLVEPLQNAAMNSADKVIIHLDILTDHEKVQVFNFIANLRSSIQRRDKEEAERKKAEREARKTAKENGKSIAQDKAELDIDKALATKAEEVKVMSSVELDDQYVAEIEGL